MTGQKEEHMTAKQSAVQDAIASLRETLKPGDTVYTVLRGVSRSGMSRNIDLYVMEGNTPRCISRSAAKAIGETFNPKFECIRVSRCGMDMGFHLVYNLSRVLFREGFKCIGKDCPANDHVNAYNNERQGQCLICRKPIGKSKLKRLNRPDSPHLYAVCSEECRTREWMHSDPGYALRHKWM